MWGDNSSGSSVSGGGIVLPERRGLLIGRVGVAFIFIFESLAQHEWSGLEGWESAGFSRGGYYILRGAGHSVWPVIALFCLYFQFLFLSSLSPCCFAFVFTLLINFTFSVGFPCLLFCLPTTMGYHRHHRHQDMEQQDRKGQWILPRVHISTYLSMVVCCFCFFVFVLPRFYFLFFSPSIHRYIHTSIPR